MVDVAYIVFLFYGFLTDWLNLFYIPLDGPNISVDIRLAPNYFPREEYGIVEELPNLVTPGEVLPFAKYLRGHGTYVNDKRELIASVAG